MLITKIVPQDAIQRGVVKIGPISVSSMPELDRLLLDYNLSAGSEEREAVIYPELDGNYAVISSLDGLGYLTDSDGMEAASSDLTDFFEEARSDQGSITITGHHISDEVKIETRMVITQQDDGTYCNVTRHKVQVSKDARTEEPEMKEEDIETLIQNADNIVALRFGR